MARLPGCNVRDLMNCNNNILSRGPKDFAQVLRHGPRHQISRCRLDSILRQHDGACLFCDILILLDHPGDPWDLPGTIEIMRTRFGTKPEGELSVQTVRPDRSDDDACFLDKSLQLTLIIYIGELNTYVGVRLIATSRISGGVRSLDQPARGRSRLTGRESVRVQLLTFCHDVLELRL